MKKISRTEAREVIEKFFSGVKDKTPKEVRKIKSLAMSHNIKLGEKKKLFCKKCFAPYSGKEKVRINKKVKSIECMNCSYVSRRRTNL